MQSGYNRLTISKWKKDTENLGMLSLINQFNSSSFPLKSWCTQTTNCPKVLNMEDKIITQKIQLTSQLDEKVNNTVYRFIDGILTKN